MHCPQIVEAFRLFDTDESGVLDAAEMHAAMFALGFVSEFNHGPSRRNSQSAKSIEAPTPRLDTEESVEGVRLEQFREMMRGSLIGSTGLDEIRMTFEAIVGASTVGEEPASASVASAGVRLRVRVAGGGQKINFENLRRACLQ